MKSANAPFNEFGQSMILRDVENLYQNDSKLTGDVATAQSAADQAETDAAAAAAAAAAAGSDAATALSTANTANANASSALTLVGNVGLIARVRDLTGYSVASGSTNVTVGPYSTTLGTATLSGLNLTTGVFTAPATGVYMASAHILFTFTGLTATQVDYCISRNSNTADILGRSFYQGNSGIAFGGELGTVSGACQLTAGDTLRVMIFLVTGTTPFLQASYFTVVRLA